MRPAPDEASSGSAGSAAAGGRAARTSAEAGPPDSKRRSGRHPARVADAGAARLALDGRGSGRGRGRGRARGRGRGRGRGGATADLSDSDGPAPDVGAESSGDDFEAFLQLGLANGHAAHGDAPEPSGSGAAARGPLVAAPGRAGTA